MHISEYDKMAHAESDMWWYQALHIRLCRLIKRYVPPDSQILDAGCGTGELMRRVQGIPDKYHITGIDISNKAARWTWEKSHPNVVVGDINDLPFKDEKFSAVVCADVLYHRAVDPHQAVREAFRCLLPKGVLIANVPAYQWMHSYHDDAIHTARRFTRRQIVALLVSEGFSVPYSSYWNTFLFPLMVIRRKLLPTPKAGNDVSVPPVFLNRLFRFISTPEYAGSA